MKILRWFWFLALFGASPCVFGAASDWKINPQGQVRLISPYNAAPREGVLYFGLQFKTKPGWHVYWKNSGDSGFPPDFKWEGSRGFSQPEVLYPAHRVFIEPGNLRAFGYEGEVVYPVRAVADGNNLHLVAQVHYLTCRDLCIPHRYTLTLDVPVRSQSQIDPEMDRLLQWYLKQVPEEDKRGNPSTLTPFPKGHGRRPGEGRMNLPWILLIAFAGGLLLNVMPCVLPVLSIKLLGFLKQGMKHRSAIARDALAGAGGILVSFLGLAFFAILARKAGHAVGWGIQFQEPAFVAFLGMIIFLFALNLWGVFEIGLPRVFGRFAASTGEDETLESHFVSGLFVTLLATPCSAPFLGTALGFALVQPAGTILAIFGAAGMGLAFPYLMLAVVPESIRWLPKPGAWMMQLQMVMGFFLALTLVWLEYVLSRQITTEGMALFNAFLVSMGLLAWVRELRIVRQHGQPSPVTRVLGVILAGLFFLSLVVVHQQRQISSSQTLPVKWIPFDEARIPSLLAEGKPVFVDVTADWCFTCKYNERAVLQDPEVMKVLQDKGIVLMRADWTNHNDVIGAYLKQFNRYGIPFYVLYEPGKAPILLSEFLTKGKVLRALGVTP